MRRGWKLVLSLFGVLVVVVAGALVYARPLLLTATGYAAHNACAVTFVAERDGDTAALDVAGEEEAHAAQWWVNERPDGSLVLPDVPADTYWASGHDGQWVLVVPSGTMVVVRMGLSPGIPGAELGVEALVSDVIAAVG